MFSSFFGGKKAAPKAAAPAPTPASNNTAPKPNNNNNNNNAPIQRGSQRQATPQYHEAANGQRQAKKNADQSIAELQNMGFSKEKAIAALEFCGFNLEAAIDYCLANMNDGNQQDNETASTTGSSAVTPAGSAKTTNTTTTTTTTVSSSPVSIMSLPTPAPLQKTVSKKAPKVDEYEPTMWVKPKGHRIRLHPAKESDAVHLIVPPAKLLIVQVLTIDHCDWGKVHPSLFPPDWNNDVCNPSVDGWTLLADRSNNNNNSGESSPTHNHIVYWQLARKG